jgi:hypothetical protein
MTLCVVTYVSVKYIQKKYLTISVNLWLTRIILKFNWDILCKFILLNFFPITENKINKTSLKGNETS